MLKGLQYFAIAAVIGFGLWVFGTSSSFQACTVEQAAANTEQTQKNPPSLALASANSAAIYARCGGHIIYEYRDFATAVATVFIAIFTFTLWQSTKKMMRATQSAVDLARQEFIATHRPRVILRYIQGPFYNNEGHRFIWLTFVNIGANGAIITAFGGDLAQRGSSEEDWAPPGLDASPQDIEPIILACGQRQVFTVTAKTSSSSDQAIFDAAIGPGHQVCAVGTIRYSDANGVERDTGFFRVLDDEGASFVVSERDTEMEYQD